MKKEIISLSILLIKYNMDSDAKHIESSSVHSKANIWLNSTMQALKICDVLDICISP